MLTQSGQRCVSDIHRAWSGLPFAPLETIVGGGRTLILAPHPDDESLGCGGLIARSCLAGRPPLVVFITDGTGSHPSSASTPPARLRRLREAEAREALCRLGLHDPASVIFLGLRDTAAPHQGPAFDAAVSDIIAAAIRCGILAAPSGTTILAAPSGTTILAAPSGTTILAPWRHDPHCDHVAADLMARQVAARAGLRHLAYPVWGWTLPPQNECEQEAVAGFRLDIAGVLEAKRRAIAAHRSQLGGLITDDPSGFTLPGQLLQVFARPFEVFVAP